MTSARNKPGICRSLGVTLGLAAGLLAVPVSAQEYSILSDSIAGCDFTTGQLDASCIPNFIGYTVKSIFGVTGMIFMVNVMIGGYQMAISGVTEDKSAGKNRIMYSILGFIACALAFLIVDFVISALING